MNKEYLCIKKDWFYLGGFLISALNGTGDQKQTCLHCQEPRRILLV